MARKDIDLDNLNITGAHKAVGADDQHFTVEDDVFIIVTQAFGPDGDDLVEYGDVEFDGYKGVTLNLKAGDREGLVHLSPFHGDRRKKGFTDIPIGTKCELFCPVSGKPLDKVGTVESTGADYFAIYLTRRMSEGEMVMISDVWGDYNSRIVDNFELVSEWAGDTED